MNQKETVTNGVAQVGTNPVQLVHMFLWLGTVREDIVTAMCLMTLQKTIVGSKFESPDNSRLYVLCLMFPSKVSPLEKTTSKM